MKIYISVDMEGLAGITHFQQEEQERERFRNALHNQLSWILEGIHKSGNNGLVEEIRIADSHNGGMNLSYDRLSALDERISLVSGSPRPFYMMTGCEDSFDAAFLVGYHAGAGVYPANMDHTFSSALIYNLWVNGQLMNEALVNAACAGSLDVPVGLVVGDSGLERQLGDMEALTWAEYVCTKESIGRYAAKFRPQKALRQDTVEAVGRVLQRDLKEIPRYILDAPYRLRIEWTQSSMADEAGQYPGVKRVDGFTTEAVLEDWDGLYGSIMGWITAARTV